jgi:hypothetical protein
MAEQEDAETLEWVAKLNRKEITKAQLFSQLTSLYLGGGSSVLDSSADAKAASAPNTDLWSLSNMDLGDLGDTSPSVTRAEHRLRRAITPRRKDDSFHLDSSLEPVYDQSTEATLKGLKKEFEEWDPSGVDDLDDTDMFRSREEQSGAVTANSGKHGSEQQTRSSVDDIYERELLGPGDSFLQAVSDRDRSRRSKVHRKAHSTHEIPTANVGPSIFDLAYDEGDMPRTEVYEFEDSLPVAAMTSGASSPVSARMISTRARKTQQRHDQGDGQGRSRVSANPETAEHSSREDDGMSMAEEYDPRVLSHVVSKSRFALRGNYI